MTVKAVIVAAGISSRLESVMHGRPKGLAQVNGMPILQRSYEILKKCGIQQTALVIGHQGTSLMEAFGHRFVYIANPFYRHSNNMASLWFAQDFVSGDPFVYLHSDLVYEERILIKALEHFGASENDIELVTDFGRPDSESMKVKVTPGHYLIESNKQIFETEAAGEWTGIALIRNAAAVFRRVEKILLDGGLQEYDTRAFSRLSRDGFKVYCSATDGLPWIEIDTPDDYERAKEIFSC